MIHPNVGSVNSCKHRAIKAAALVPFLTAPPSESVPQGSPPLSMLQLDQEGIINALEDSDGPSWIIFEVCSSVPADIISGLKGIHLMYQSDSIENGDEVVDGTPKKDHDQKRRFIPLKP